MISPKPLKQGDKIGIVATARRITREQTDAAIRILAEWGLDVKLSPHLYNESHSYLAGTDDERTAALQQFLDDDTLSAIICARGGYGTTRIIDRIDLTQFKRKPKWLVGFSDVTSLHLKLASTGIESIHGIMPILFGKDGAGSSVLQLKSALFGEPLEITTNSSNNHNRIGEGKGRLLGGNLSLLVDSLGTPYEPVTEGTILVLEEVDEFLYKIDRMVVQLKRAGKLEKLAGLAVGHFTDIKDTELPFGETLEEIIRYHTKEFSYPVGFNFPTGHENPNFPWIEGREAILTVTPTQSILRHLTLTNQA